MGAGISGTRVAWTARCTGREIRATETQENGKKIQVLSRTFYEEETTSSYRITHGSSYICVLVSDNHRDYAEREAWRRRNRSTSSTRDKALANDSDRPGERVSVRKPAPGIHSFSSEFQSSKDSS